MCLARTWVAAALLAFTVADRAVAQDSPDTTAPEPTQSRKPARRPAREAKKPDAAKPDAKKPDAKSSRPAAAKPNVPGGSSATLVATFSDWSAYTAQSGRSKICYALSQPKGRSPGNLKDTPAYLFVSQRPADNVRNELATVLNFKTKDGGAASLAVGSTTYDLVTKGENAWIKNAAEEGTAISTMAKGASVTVQATSARGNKTSDRYSLAGFAQALDRARRDCP